MQNKLNSNFIASLTSVFTPVIDADFLQKDYVEIDLSVANTALDEVDVTSAEAIAAYIAVYLQEQKAQVAYGGYLEQRAIYDRSNYFYTENETARRNIHLGIDIWCPFGTAVIAPYPARVHSFQDNKNYGDYGPCAILEHQLNECKFYSLYGHLSRRSLKFLRVGAVIKKGETFAVLGTPEENGNYAPHLHFQLILDIQNNYGDYPGVTAKKNLDFYRSNCPDPNLLLKINDPQEKE